MMVKIILIVALIAAVLLPCRIRGEIIDTFMDYVWPI